MISPAQPSMSVSVKVRVRSWSSDSAERWSVCVSRTMLTTLRGTVDGTAESAVIPVWLTKHPGKPNWLLFLSTQLRVYRAGKWVKSFSLEPIVRGDGKFCFSPKTCSPLKPQVLLYYKVQLKNNYSLDIKSALAKKWQKGPISDFFCRKICAWSQNFSERNLKDLMFGQVNAA